VIVVLTTTSVFDNVTTLVVSIPERQMPDYRSASMCEWQQEGLSGASATRATFHLKLEQLKRASDAFHRDGVDFLLMLLDPDAAHRMTAEGALAGFWPGTLRTLQQTRSRQRSGK
jgi:hypothetical protein